MSSHAKVERLDTSVCSGRGGPEFKKIQTVHLDVSWNPLTFGCDDIWAQGMCVLKLRSEVLGPSFNWRVLRCEFKLS